MPNLLAIPVKKTYSLPIHQAVSKHIQARHPNTHPDEFKWDVDQWETQRREALLNADINVNRVKALITYHAQLVFILTKLPADIGLEVAYAPMFSPSALPIALSDLNYERCGVLLNLAALYSQLSSAENRDTPEGMKRAIMHSQNAAGTLSYLTSTALPKLRASKGSEPVPEDMSESLLKGFEWLMLAQAQECVWQRAVHDKYRDALVGKLAAEVSYQYKNALTVIRDSSPSIKHVLPSEWLPHIETKVLHFEAASLFRQSCDDREKSRYGEEIARLTSAQAAAKKGYDIARRNKILPAVLEDIKTLLDRLDKEVARAKRDNDLIYLKDVPSAASLPAVGRSSIAKITTPVELQEPKNAISGQKVLFGELLGWGARTAIEIYQERRKDYIKDEVRGKAHKLDDEANSVLRTLNLPAAIDALEKPIGLPPSLLQKAEEVRSEDGPQKVQKQIEDVGALGKRNMDLLDEALDILDQEVEDDESFQESMPSMRMPSHEANQEFIEKAKRYRGILTTAADSDELIRQRWLDWERNIVQLTWDEDELEQSIPSPTISPTGPARSTNSVSQKSSRHLRRLLEHLDDLQRARSDLVKRAERLADADDITPRILTAAAKMENLLKDKTEDGGWIEVKPEMLEGELEDELAKYEKFARGVEENGAQQEHCLKEMDTVNETFLASRRDDPVVNERQHAIQSLDLAYHKYKEIVRHLEDGLKFYNQFSDLLVQFKDGCKTWANARRDHIHMLQNAARTQPSSPQAEHEPELIDPSDEAILDAAYGSISAQPQAPLSPIPSTEYEPDVVTQVPRRSPVHDHQLPDIAPLPMPPQAIAAPQTPRRTTRSQSKANSQTPLTEAHFRTPGAAPKTPAGQRKAQLPPGFDMPPPDSDMWEAMNLPPPPTTTPAKGKGKAVGRVKKAELA